MIKELQMSKEENCVNGRFVRDDKLMEKINSDFGKWSRKKKRGNSKANGSFRRKKPTERGKKKSQME